MPRLADEDKDVRLAVIDLLGQLGSPTVLPYILNALNDENEWVRIRAIDALGMHRVADAVPELAQMLESASPMVALKIVGSSGFSVGTPVRNWPGRGLDRHRRSRWLS